MMPLSCVKPRMTTTVCTFLRMPHCFLGSRQLPTLSGFSLEFCILLSSDKLTGLWPSTGEGRSSAIPQPSWKTQLFAPELRILDQVVPRQLDFTKFYSSLSGWHWNDSLSTQKYFKSPPKVGFLQCASLALPVLLPEWGKMEYPTLSSQ